MKSEFRLLCEKYGMRQVDMIRKFDIPLRTVQCWYSGVRQPPDYVLAMIDKILSIEVK